jgi:GNAT superfamily N-acetyltransferase
VAPVIRIATVADAETIAAIHVAAWKETYTGLVPDSLIAAQSVGDRTERWRHILVSGAWDETTTFLVRTSTGQAVGFGSCGRQRTIDLHALGFDGEIYAIYLLQSAQGQGVGRRLLAAMARRRRVDMSSENTRSRPASTSMTSPMVGETLACCCGNLPMGST